MTKESYSYMYLLNKQYTIKVYGFFPSSLKRHYLILLYKHYVEGVPMDELYTAIPKCLISFGKPEERITEKQPVSSDQAETSVENSESVSAQETNSELEVKLSEPMKEQANAQASDKSKIETELRSEQSDAEQTEVNFSEGEHETDAPKKRRILVEE